jgi:hypothetical protein
MIKLGKIRQNEGENTELHFMDANCSYRGVFGKNADGILPSVFPTTFCQPQRSCLLGFPSLAPTLPRPVLLCPSPVARSGSPISSTCVIVVWALVAALGVIWQGGQLLSSRR